MSDTQGDWAQIAPGCTAIETDKHGALLWGETLLVTFASTCCRRLVCDVGVSRCLHVGHGHKSVTQGLFIITNIPQIGLSGEA